MIRMMLKNNDFLRIVEACLGTRKKLMMMMMILMLMLNRIGFYNEKAQSIELEIIIMKRNHLNNTTIVSLIHMLMVAMIQMMMVMMMTMGVTMYS